MNTGCHRSFVALHNHPSAPVSGNFPVCLQASQKLLGVMKQMKTQDPYDIMIKFESYYKLLRSIKNHFIISGLWPKAICLTLPLLLSLSMAYHTIVKCKLLGIEFEIEIRKIM